jgi:F-type H+-transporting ATPase subunit a
MPKLGCLGKTIIAVIVVLGLVIISILFFPIPSPHVALPADPIFNIGGFPITNTLLASFFTIVVVAGLFFAATRKMKLVPKGLQNAVEMVYEMLYNFVEGVAGEKYARRFFPIVTTIFLYVIMAAWLSLLPGFDTIGGGHMTSAAGEPGAFFGTYHGWIVTEPLFKKANTDINFPLALALISFVFVEFMGITALGFRRYVSRFIAVGPLFHSLGQLFRGHIRTAMSELFTGIVEIFTGFLETISEFVRIISFTFRLFGNMTAGMVLLLIVMFLIPWVVAVPFYGLELLFGFVQALIFAGLTLVFVTLAVTPRELE